jgi:MFS family permease
MLFFKLYLFFRLLQGAGASCGSVLGQTIAREALPEDQKNHFFSMSGFVLAFAISLGPFIGGHLTHWLDWRANFLFLSLIGFFVLLATAMILPETMVKLNKNDAIQTFPLFKKMLMDKHIVCSAWIVGACNGMLFSYYAEGPFIFIKKLQLTSIQFGYLGFFIAIAALVGSLTSKRLVRRLSQQQMMNIGIVILLISSVFFMTVTVFVPIDMHHQLLSITLLILSMMGLIFSCFGFLLPSTLNTALTCYKNYLGRAGALFGLSYYGLVSVFTWLMGALHNGTVWMMPLYFIFLTTSIILASVVKNQSNRANKTPQEPLN